MVPFQALSYALMMIASFSSLVTYKFSQSFGQIFKDLSGSGNHGQNGQSISTLSLDTISTSRGAYFSEGINSYILLPPNEINPKSLNFGSSFTLAIWINSLDNNDYFLSYRQSQTSNDYFYLKKKDNLNGFITRIKQGNYDSSVQTSPTNEILKNGTWVYLVMINEGNVVTFHANNIVALTLTLPTSYFESGNYLHYIGYKESSFEGLVWSFYLFNQYKPISDFYSALYSGTNCLVIPCPASCSPAIKENNIEYCISVSLEFTCPGCDAGCLNNICLDCKTCSSGSCILSSATVKCACFQSIHCNTLEYCNSVENLCNSCYPECFSCSEASKCSRCKDLNAIAHEVIGCVCKQGFYNTSALYQGGICLPCNSNCLHCLKDQNCNGCKYENAQLSGETTCSCIDGFYNLNPLTDGGICYPCNSDCKTCDQEFRCLKCKDENAEIHPEVGCMCNVGFFNLTSLSKNGSCQACLNGCKRCSSRFVCTECLDFNSKMIRKADCIICSGISFEDDDACSCKSGFFIDDSKNLGICEACSNGCLECLNSTACLRCKDFNAELNSNMECICNDGFWKAGKDQGYSCVQCSGCKTCKSLDFCLSCSDPNEEIDNTGRCRCKNNFIYIENICTCPKGFKLEESSCIDYFFSMQLTINQENRIHVNFSQIPLNLTNEDFKVSLNSQEFTSQIFKVKVNSFFIKISSNQQINQGTSCRVSIIKDSILSENGAKLDEYSKDIELYEMMVINQQLKVIISKMKTTSQASVTASIGIAMASNPAAAWSLVNTLQFINYIPLGNDPLTLTIRQLFLASGGFNMLPNIINFVFSRDLSSKPSKGPLNNGIEGSVFCINAGQIILMLIGLIMLFPILKLISKLPIEGLSKRCSSIITKNSYSAFLRLWIQSYLDLVVFALIQIMSKNENDSRAFRINHFLAGMTLVRFNQFLAIVSIPASLVIILSYYKKIQANNQDLFIKYGSLYSELNPEMGKIALLYNFFYFLRRIFYALNQFFLHKFLNLQRILNILFSFASLVYLIVFRPFKELESFILNLASEICILAIFICVDVLSFTSSSSEALIENIVTYTLVSYIALQLLTSLTFFLIRLISKIRKYRELNDTRVSYEV